MPGIVVQPELPLNRYQVKLTGWAMVTKFSNYGGESQVPISDAHCGGCQGGMGHGESLCLEWETEIIEALREGKLNPVEGTKLCPLLQAITGRAISNP